MKRILIIAGLILAIVAARVWITLDAPPASRDITLRFHPYVGAERLVLNTGRYQNPGGPGIFSVRDFQFFASNIKAGTSSGEYVETDSYHLVRFDSEEGWFDITLRGVAPGKINWIEIGVGVDAHANGIILIAGDLDPNSRMAWNWETGYKFILVEGTIELEDGQEPIVYHVGFDENYRVARFDLASQDNDQDLLEFRVDLAALFSGDPPFDIASIPSVRFDREDAARIGAGFGELISLCIDNCPD